MVFPLLSRVHLRLLKQSCNRRFNAATLNSAVRWNVAASDSSTMAVPSLGMSKKTNNLKPKWRCPRSLGKAVAVNPGPSGGILNRWWIECV
jgi:hypothetical protein